MIERLKKLTRQEIIEELETYLLGKKHGHVTIFKLPNTTHPAIEIVLLDPHCQMVVYRNVSGSNISARKAAKWIIGKPEDAVNFAKEFAAVKNK